MSRLEAQLRAANPMFADLVRGLPLQESPPLPPDWLRCEVLERYLVLRHAPLAGGATVLEVGSGGHALSTIPLAFRVGPTGRVLAAERARWAQFRSIVAASGLGDQVRPVACDARRLPLRDNAVDLALCIHGVRSLESEENMAQVFREMLRVAPRLFLAESLPIAHTDAQRAHLAMYDLREDVFRATTGRRDDLHYRPLGSLVRLVERAGGVVESAETLEVNLPHALAHFPRAMVMGIPDVATRKGLLLRWDEANSRCERYGTDHPPVGMVSARRP